MSQQQVSTAFTCDIEKDSAAGKFFRAVAVHAVLIRFRKRIRARLVERHRQANLPTVSHKHKDTYDDAVVEDTHRCVHCGAWYKNSENVGIICKYHPGPAKALEIHVHSVQDKIQFNCCGGIQIGSNPIVGKVEGCKQGVHMSRYDVDQANLKVIADKAEKSQHEPVKADVEPASPRAA